jgi:hypothetical protein
MVQKMEIYIFGLKYMLALLIKGLVLISLICFYGLVLSIITSNYLQSSDVNTNIFSQGLTIWKENFVYLVCGCSTSRLRLLY